MVSNTRSHRGLNAAGYVYNFYIVHSVHYDVLQVWYLQQMHNSTMNVLFVLFNTYVFRHFYCQEDFLCCHLPQAW